MKFIFIKNKVDNYILNEFHLSSFKHVFDATDEMEKKEYENYEKNFEDLNIFEKKIFLEEKYFRKNMNLFIRYDFIKNKVKKRKLIYKSKPGVSSNDKKNSIRRDKNNLLNILFLNEIFKKGLKNRYFLYMNIFVENFFEILDYYNPDFEKYEKYKHFIFLLNNEFEYNNLEFILNDIIPKYNCVFDIKTKKNPKYLKVDKKYSHFIKYVPKERRIKKSLKAMSFYIENYKNYFFWERLFWLFLSVILNTNKSFLVKRRQFIYKKSLKFFKR